MTKSKINNVSTIIFILIIFVIIIHIYNNTFSKKDLFTTLNNATAIKSLSSISQNTLNIVNNDDINNLMVNGVFRLKVNLPNVPPYIKGEDFDMNVGINPNYFYLCMVKLDPNCNIIALNGSCLQLYVDERKCSNKKLSVNSQLSPYRLVLIPEKYALDTTLPFINNINFTLVNVNNLLYLKNTNTNYFPSLFTDNSTINVTGNMINDSKSNVANIPSLINNNICNEHIQPIDLNSPSLNVNCLIYPDSEKYLMTTTDITLSSPIDIQINNNNTINISLKTYNMYGFSDDSYSLIIGDFDINTYKHIEIVTIENIFSIFVNMVYFDSNKTGKLSKNNKLNFVVENISLPVNFIKNANII